MYRNLTNCVSRLDQIIGPPDWDYNGDKAAGFPFSRASSSVTGRLLPVRKKLKPGLMRTEQILFIKSFNSRQLRQEVPPLRAAVSGSTYTQYAPVGGLFKDPPLTQVGLFTVTLDPRPSWPQLLLPNMKSFPFSAERRSEALKCCTEKLIQLMF